MCVVGDTVWIGERDGDITIKTLAGETLRTLENARRDAFVWSICDARGFVWVGYSNSVIRVFNPVTYEVLIQLKSHSGGVYTLAYQKGFVFSGSNDFKVLMWDASTYQYIRQFSGHRNSVRALLVDGDRDTLYSGSDDRTVMVWNIGYPEHPVVWSGHAGGVHSLLKVDQHVWSGSEDATIRVWDTATGECIKVLEAHAGTVTSLTLVGDKVWSGGLDGVRLWHAATFRLAGTFAQTAGYVTSIVTVGRVELFKVWSAGSDSVISVWEAPAPATTTPASAITDGGELETANRDLVAKVRQLERVNHHLEGQVDYLERCNDEYCQKLAAMDKSNTQLAREVGDRDHAIASLETAVRSGREGVSDLLNGLLAESAGPLLGGGVSGALADEVGELKLQLERVVADARRANQEKETMGAQLREAEAEVAALRKARGALELHVRDYGARSGDQVQQITHLNSAISNRDQEIRRLESLVTAVDDALAPDASAVTAGQYVGALRHELAALRAQLASGAAAAATGELDSLSAAIRARDQTIERLEAEVSQLRHRAATYEQRLAAVTASSAQADIYAAEAAATGLPARTAGAVGVPDVPANAQQFVLRTRPQLVRQVWQLHRPLAQGNRAAAALVNVARQASEVVSRLHAANASALAGPSGRSGPTGRVHSAQAGDLAYLREASDFINDNAAQLDIVLRDANATSQGIVTELFTDVERLHVGHKAAAGGAGGVGAMTTAQSFSAASVMAGGGHPMQQQQFRPAPFAGTGVSFGAGAVGGAGTHSRSLMPTRVGGGAQF